MILGRLSAGMASAPLPVPRGVDLVGYLRRAEPAGGHGQPLELGSLVLDDGDNRVVIISLDTLGVPAAWSTAIRAAVAGAAGCRSSEVMVNASHTHAAPPPPVLRKLGGRLEHQDAEVAYADAVVNAAAQTTESALSRLAPVVAMVSRGEGNGLVNRRQRLADGRMALGNNPNGPTERSVSVVALDSLEGTPVATVVSVACHPLVIGPDVAETSSDFVGPLRDRMRSWTGAECMFLQGCAGNMMPMYAMYGHTGPEVSLGRSLVLDALRVREACQRQRIVPRMEQVYSSAVPFAVWRETYADPPGDVRLRAEEVAVEVPMSPLPSVEEIASVKTELTARLTDLEDRGEAAEVCNPVRIHLDWAAAMESRIRAGGSAHVRTSVQLLSLGGLAIYGLPGEPFCELGMEIARHSPADFSLVLGYTNDAIGYIATDEEMWRGGYEPGLSHRHYDQPAPFGYGAADALVRAALSMS